jgi:hypothetical protein
MNEKERWLQALRAEKHTSITLRGAIDAGRWRGQENERWAIEELAKLASDEAAGAAAHQIDLGERGVAAAEESVRIGWSALHLTAMGVIATLIGLAIGY